MDDFFIPILVTLIMARHVLNVMIYRREHDYHEYTDGVASDFSEEEVAKRDAAVALHFLSFFTFFWINYKKKANKQLVVASNSVMAIAILFYFAFR